MAGKKFWLIIGLILFLSALFIETITAQIRGYGFFTVSRTGLKEPKWIASNELQQFEKLLHEYLADPNIEAFPDANTIAHRFVNWRFSDVQPFKSFDIWVFESPASGMPFLYKPMPATSTPETVVCCTKARYEDPPGVYHAYERFPGFVLNHFGGEKWSYMRADLAVFHTQSSLPPVPGAIIIGEEVKYPKPVLPVLKAIYPDLAVPKERIIE